MKDNEYVKLIYEGIEKETLRREIIPIPITFNSKEQTHVEITYVDQSGLDKSMVLIQPTMGRLEECTLDDESGMFIDKGNLWNIYWGGKKLTIYKTKEKK